MSIMRAVPPVVRGNSTLEFLVFLLGCRLKLLECKYGANQLSIVFQRV